MDPVLLGAALALVYVVGLWGSGRSLARETRRAAEAKQPPPRILAWWDRVARATSWLAPLGVALVALGLWRAWLWAGLAGVVALAYVGQAWWMRRCARLALSGAAR